MSDPVLHVGGWQLDIGAHQISKNGVNKRLEPKVMQVLTLLAAQPGVVISRSEFLTAVWGGAFVGDDALSAAIIKLRRAFDDDARAPHVVETVHKSGYRLIATVVSHPPDQPSQREELPGPSNPSVKFATLLRCTYRAASFEPASMGPEQWQRATDEIADALNAIIESHGGVTIHESGATIGVFGAPVAQEHHAMRAVQAALDIRAMTMTTATLDGAGHRLGHIWRVGLASGQVLSSVTIGGSGLTVHGAPLDAAAALATAAKPGEILLTSETHRLAQGLVGAQRCDPLPIQPEVGDVYRLGADAGWSTAWEARVERGLTPLFGRNFEIGRITDLLEGVAGGEGRIVAMGGEPGAGKSRLVHEAMLQAVDRGFDTFIASASPLESRTPFFPVRTPVMSRLHLGRETVMDVPTLRTQLDDSDADNTIALLATLRPDSVGDEWTSIDPDLRRARCVSALSRVILESGDRPQLIVFEDLHWADESTRNLVDAVVAHIARRPCMVMVTYRPEFADPWAAKSYYTPLRIDALDRTASLEMIGHLVGDDISVEQWKDSVVGLSGGTPLFIEEVVRSAHASGTLISEEGVPRLTETAPSTVPSSIHTIIADRVDRLSDGAREILSLAAVIGSDVPAALLHPLLDGTLLSRTHQLEELQAAELLFASRYQREAGYVFKHALIQEVAYREIPRSIRSEHHRRIAALMRTFATAGSPFSAELLARHHAGAGQHRLAIDAWIRAADSAISAAAFADAVEHLEQARSCLGEAPAEEHDELSLLIELRTMSTLIQSVGPADPEVAAACTRARELASAHGTPRQQFEAAWGSWFVHLMRGEINAAQPLGDEVFELAGTLDDKPLQLEAHHVQWSGFSLSGDPKAVREHAQIGIEHYEPSEHHWLTFSYGGHDPGVCAWNLDAMALWLLDESELAMERSTLAISLADELGHPYTRLESFNSALNIALLDADADTLLEHTDVLHALVDSGTLPDIASAYANGFRANALVLRGDLASGLELMVEAAPVWQEFWGAWCFPLDSAFSTTLAKAGRVDEAIAHVEMQLAAANVSGAHWWDAEFHRVLGELTVLRDPTDLGQATAHFERALEVSRRQSTPFLEHRAAASLASALLDDAR